MQMPGTKAKQAKALAFNIEWLGQTFGVERLGFLTLTVGDTVEGKFVKVRDRAEAERRFNSILNRIREKYQCGVVVVERHKDGGVHFHLVVVVEGDIKTGLDFAAVGLRDYRSASATLRAEWAWWRENAPDYGFGRHELLPVRTTGQQIGRYVAKYLGKSWSERTPDDRGKRCLRYFGRWSKSGVKCGPPMSSRFGAMTPKAQAWRACMKQIQMATKLNGVELHENNIKELVGPRWAWRLTKQLARFRFFIPARAAEAVRQGLADHNEEAQTLSAAHVGDSTLDHWIPCVVERYREWAYSYGSFVAAAGRRWLRRWEARQLALANAFIESERWFNSLGACEAHRLSTGQHC